jgi:hypothetical protein
MHAFTGVWVLLELEEPHPLSDAADASIATATAAVPISRPVWP